MGNGTPIHMLRYEKRFKNALFPDKIKLTNGFELSIPTEIGRNKMDILVGGFKLAYIKPSQLIFCFCS